MPGVIVVCAQCGADYEPTRERILRGKWKICPACSSSPADTATTTCEQCGRELRGTSRRLCLGCLLGGPIV